MKAPQKWALQRVSALIVSPFIVWFFYVLIYLSGENYDVVTNFFSKPLFSSLTIILLTVGFFHAKNGLSEIFEDYIHNEKIKSVANLLTLLFSIIIPALTITILLYKF